MDDSAVPQHILTQFNLASECAGWGAYWRYFYQSLWDLKHQDDGLNQAIKFVRFEDLCLDSDDCLDQVFQHAELDSAGAEQIKNDYRDALSPPDYYELPFTAQEKNDIMGITRSVADLFRYDTYNHT